MLSCRRGQSMNRRLLVRVVVVVAGCGFDPAPQVHRVLVRSSTSWRAVMSSGETVRGQGTMVLVVGEERPWCVDVERISATDSSSLFLRLYAQTGGMTAPTVEIDISESNEPGIGARVCVPRQP